MCVCDCVCVEWQEIESDRVQILYTRDCCFSNRGSTAGQLFSVKGTNTEYASWMSDYHFPGRKIWPSSPWILIRACFMVARLHDWNRFSARNSPVKVNYEGYWNYGRCHDCHYIFLSHHKLCRMKMINGCFFCFVFLCMLRKKAEWYLCIHKYVMDAQLSWMRQRTSDGSRFTRLLLVFYCFTGCWWQLQ